MDYMARLAEDSWEENISMGTMAKATKVDNEAMKTISIMTMMYLPAMFVAVSNETECSIDSSTSSTS